MNPSFPVGKSMLLQTQKNRLKSAEIVSVKVQKHFTDVGKTSTYIYRHNIYTEGYRESQQVTMLYGKFLYAGVQGSGKLLV